MGKRKLLTGVVLGASIGGLLSLLNKDARNYAKDKTNQAYNQFQTCLQNPSNSVRRIKETVIRLNDAIASNTNSAVNALDQVENSLNKMLPNKD